MKDHFSYIAMEIAEEFPCTWETVDVELRSMAAEFPEVSISKLKELVIERLKLKLSMGTL